MPVWLFIVYTGSTHLTYFGTGFQAGSGDTIQPALLSPHWRRMLVSNHGGVGGQDEEEYPQKRRLAPRVGHPGLLRPSAGGGDLFPDHPYRSLDGADLNPAVATGLFVATVAVILLRDTGRVRPPSVAAGGARRLADAPLQAHGPRVFRECAGGAAEGQAIGRRARRRAAAYQCVRPRRQLYFARPTTFFVVWQMSQLVCFSVGAMMSPSRFCSRSRFSGTYFTESRALGHRQRAGVRPAEPQGLQRVRHDGATGDAGAGQHPVPSGVGRGRRVPPAPPARACTSGWSAGTASTRRSWGFR